MKNRLIFVYIPGWEEVADIPATGQVVHQKVDAGVDGQQQVGYLHQSRDQLKMKDWN